jgi:AraC-like DNA-binding protein
MAARGDEPLAEELELHAPDGGCALFHLRVASAVTRRVVWDAPAFVFARGATVATLAVSPAGRRHAGVRPPPLDLSVAAVAVVPAGTAATVTSGSSTTELLVLLPTPGLVSATAATYHVPEDRMVRALGAWQLLPRERWLDEVQHRYFFERVACKKKDNLATAFLEMEVVKETYFLAARAAAAEDFAARCVPPFTESAGIGPRAIRHLEEHLFEPLSLDRLARAVGASRATLVRHFRAAAGKAPAEYLRERRLDEARALLERGAKSVADVAFAVGYENVAAFAQAFKRRWGESPRARKAVTAPPKPPARSRR